EDVFARAEPAPSRRRLEQRADVAADRPQRQPRALDERAMIFVRGDGDAMPAPLQLRADGDERLRIAARADGDEREVHLAIIREPSRLVTIDRSFNQSSMPKTTLRQWVISAADGGSSPCGPRLRDGRISA